MNLYKVTTRSGENSNWDAFYVAAEDGMQAATYLQAQKLNRNANGKPKKTRNESVDEVAFVAPIHFTV